MIQLVGVTPGLLTVRLDFPLRIVSLPLWLNWLLPTTLRASWDEDSARASTPMPPATEGAGDAPVLPYTPIWSVSAEPKTPQAPKPATPAAPIPITAQPRGKDGASRLERVPVDRHRSCLLVSPV